MKTALCTLLPLAAILPLLPAQTHVRLADLRPGNNSSSPVFLGDVDGRTLFSARPTPASVSLYRTDGTPASTMQDAIQIPAGGTVQGDMLRVGSQYFFVANEPTYGAELWVSDGTPGGTRIVADINPGPYQSGPRLLTKLGSRVAWLAQKADTLTRLFVSDGTAQGTVDLGPVAIGNELFAIESQLVFIGHDIARGGDEPWITDGTPAGTKLLKDVQPGPLSSAAEWFTELNGQLLFVADDGTHGLELWISDLTANGTRLLADIATGSASLTPRHLVRAGGRVYFAATVSRELWMTDGTAAGTQKVPASTPFSVDYYHIAGAGYVDLDGVLLFAATTINDGLELWRTDGTLAGTKLVKDIAPGYASGLLAGHRLVRFGSRAVFFTAAGPGTGYELWRSDGTAAGTMLVADIAPGAYSSYAGQGGMTTAGGRIVCSAQETATGTEPYAVHAGALAHRIGWGCGNGAREATLDGTDPVLGGTLTFRGGGAKAGSAGAVIVGLPASKPAPLGGSCRLWFDLTAFLVLPGFSITGATWTQSVPLPGDAAWNGIGLVAQSFFAGTDAPHGYEVGNALFLRLGN